MTERVTGRVVADEELAAATVLAEPPAGGRWVAAVTRRLVVAAGAPVGVGVEGPAAERLREAGWLLLDAGAGVDAIAAARAASWPQRAALAAAGPVAGVGSLAPALVVVGAGRGGQVWEALRALGWDELRVRATNARGPRGRRFAPTAWQALAAAVAPSDPVWLAVGADAARALASVGVAHVAVPHPQVLGRAELAAHLLRDAGLPEGPWAAPRALPVASCADGVAPPPRRRGPHLDPAKAEAGKRLYVTGVAANVADAAREAGVEGSTSAMQDLARREGWHAQRAAHARKVTTAAKARVVEREAEQLAAMRVIATAAARLALEDVTERVRAARGAADSMARLRALREAGDSEARPLHPSPAQTRHLVYVAQALRQEPGAAGPTLPLVDLADEVTRLLEELT